MNMWIATTRLRRIFENRWDFKITGADGKKQFVGWNDRRNALYQKSCQ